MNKSADEKESPFKIEKLFFSQKIGALVRSVFFVNTYQKPPKKL